MAWKIKGKIGCHFPDRTGLNPNFDVARIVYSQDGIEANAKEIEKVYYISPAAATAIAAQTTQEARMAELAKWLVWQKYWEEPPTQRTLVMDTSGYVLIKYTPSQEDIVANTIGIFTTNNNTNGRCILILNENERQELINETPESHRIIKRFVSSEDFINNKIRYCLWFSNEDLLLARKSKILILFSP